jgi:uncharacterized LabA/DUF88 family protein
MFEPKTDRIKKLSLLFPDRIRELEGIFDKPTIVYIDYANVYRWQEKLGWHLDLKRLKQILDSFDQVKKVKFYYGTLVGSAESVQMVDSVIRMGYEVITKSVKIMKLPINVSSIPPDSPDIIKQFIRPPLLLKLDLETITYLNAKLKKLNQQGIMEIEDLKCNFDVEIGRDMLLDYAKSSENFILWSGDSDFSDPLRQLLEDGKKCYIFATVRRVAKELNELRSKGLLIYDIQKMREFICWPREMKVRGT